MAKKEELLVFLKKNLEIFSWSMYEVLGVDPEFICHHLNVNPTITPKQQPQRSSKEHVEVVKKRSISSSKLGKSMKSFILNGWPTL